MNTHDKSATPDFKVRWRNASLSAAENFYCAAPIQSELKESKAGLYKSIAAFQTPTTDIVVSEVTWTEPTTLTVIANRLGFCLAFSTSPNSSSIEYGYAHDDTNLNQQGRILLMLPGREICSHSNPSTIRTVMCSFEQAYAESIVGSLDDFSSSQLHNALDLKNSLISTLMLRLMNEALYPGPLSNTVVESFGHAMLVECAHWLSMNESKSDSGGRLTARHFKIIEEYLAGLSGAAPSVPQLATACGFSASYFAKLFREQTHCSVAHYIKSVQIAKAKTYLLETDLPLKEIAYGLGFSTPANFSLAFREATGSTPGQFRKTK